jgi:hypothetical protein
MGLDRLGNGMGRHFDPLTRDRARCPRTAHAAPARAGFWTGHRGPNR